MMHSWQQWAILSLKHRAPADGDRTSRQTVHRLDRNAEPIAGHEAGRLWTAVLGGTRQILIIGLGVALGELLVRFVWSYLIWQFIVQRLP